MTLSDDYASFVRQMVERRNRLVEGKLEQELLCLPPLPPAPVPEYVNYQSKVRKWCTIQVAGHSYSVPSRLIGKEVAGSPDRVHERMDWVAGALALRQILDGLIRLMSGNASTGMTYGL